ncbi:MAG: AraC family transcriptional regulator [Nannocystaceae bacterium]
MTHLASHAWVSTRRFTSELASPCRSVVHDHASIALYLEGRAKFWMQGLYELGPGDLLLVPAGSPHYSVEAKGVRSIGVSLCLPCVPAPAREGLSAAFDAVGRGGCATRRLVGDERDRLERLFLDLERELDRGGASGALAVEAYVSLLTVAIARADEGAAASGRRGGASLVARALEYVQRHASAGISLRDVARHVARSPAHVASQVKEATGETVVGWITRARMSECRRLLVHTDENTEQIAERCGFASASHFHRAFKRAHGMTPGEWRRTHRGGAAATVP